MISILIILYLTIFVMWLINGKKSSNSNNNKMDDNNNYNSTKDIVLKRLPGPINLPILGCALQLAFESWGAKNFEVFERMCKKYGPVIELKAGILNIVVVEDYDVAKKVLFSDDFTNRFPNQPMYLSATMDTNAGLVFGSGETCRQMRRYLIRSLHEFGFGELDTLEHSIHEELVDFLNYFESFLGQNSNEVCLRHCFNLPALNLVWRVMCGSRFSIDDCEMKKVISIVAEISSMVSIGTQPLFAFPFLRHIPGTSSYSEIIKGLEKLQNVFKEIMSERRLTGSFKTVQHDFIDLFLKKIDESTNESPEIFSDEQLIQCCVDLVLAGSDTTSNELEFIMLFMAKYPEVQEKVQEEIDSVIGPNRIPSLSDRANMPYTEATILESLRFASSLPIEYRAAVRDTTLCGCFVKKDTIVTINAGKIHMNQQLWGDPENFRPNRFIDENNTIVRDNKLIAFGGGKRMCIGYTLAKSTLFTFLATILQKYKLQPSIKYPDLSLNSTMGGFTCFPKPYYCRINPREILE